MICTGTDNHVNVKSTIKKGKKKNWSKNRSLVSWLYGQFTRNSLELLLDECRPTKSQQNLKKVCLVITFIEFVFNF